MRKQINKEVEPTVVASPPLHVKYRPKVLTEVVGQGPVVKSLDTMLKMGSHPHTFLFTGPAGTGKTTLARILAARFNCSTDSMIEVDAASNSGIDDMRKITGALRYNGFGEHPNKAIIIDECQGLSKQAWDSLLKSTEEPPPHVYFFFCSTNPEKIPAAMMTRCVAFNLKPVKIDDLLDLLEKVCDSEGYETDMPILRQVANACEGSPRAALTMLAKVHDCDDEQEAATLLQMPTDSAEVIELCRGLIRGQLDWAEVTRLLKALSDIPAETIRILIVNYLNVVLMGAKKDSEITRLLDILECFSKPCNPSDKTAPLLISFGRLLYP